MKKALMVLITISLFFLLNYTTTNAQDNIILFHSNSCGYSKDLILAIEEADINEILEIEMMEASQEDFDEVFNKSLGECNIERSKAGFPTLYHNGECSVGSLNAMDTLLTLAGIDTEEEITEEEITESQQMTPTEEVRTLSEVEQEVFEVEPRPFWQILVMFIGPAILIGLAYFMIKKLNL